MNKYHSYEKRFLLNEEEYRTLISFIYLKLKYDEYRKYKVRDTLYMNNFSPLAYCTFDRLVMEGQDDESLSICFDTNFKFIDNTSISGNDIITLLPMNKSYIMRIKCNGNFPIWLNSTLRQLDINQYVPNTDNKSKMNLIEGLIKEEL